MESKLIRDRIIQALKKEKEFSGMVAAEFNGTYFAAADIAFPDAEGICRQYRVAVIPHGPKKIVG